MIAYSQPSDGIEMELLPEEAFAVHCHAEAEAAMPESFATGECHQEAEAFLEAESLQPVSIVPVNTAQGATEVVSAEGNSGVAANTSANVDTVVRPLYDGALTFNDIRNATAPEEYSWEVGIEEGQYMVLIDPQHVEVFYGGGHPAFAISAQAAHDAVGNSVPTYLKVSGNTVTQVVAHRGGNFVYPIVAGVGWEGGFTTTQIAGPRDEKELREEKEQLARELKEATEAEDKVVLEATIVEVESESPDGILRTASFGPPTVELANNLNEPPKRLRAFRFNECHFSEGDTLPISPGDITKRTVPNGTSQQCHGSYEEHDGVHSLEWAYAVAGEYHYHWGQNAWISEPIHCVPPWGPKKPLQLGCYGPGVGVVSIVPLEVQDRARWDPGNFAPNRSAGQYACGEILGVLPLRPKTSENGERIVHETMRFNREFTFHLPCGWDHLKAA